MADDFFNVKLTGLEQCAAELRALPGKLRKRAIMNALRAGGRVVRDEARNTPGLVASVPVRRKGRLIRQPGTVRKAISVRTSKQATREGNLGVFINVKPAKGFNRGKYNPFDPFYWKWLEKGRKGRPMPVIAFLKHGAGRLSQALTKITESLGPAIQKFNQKGAQP